MPRQIFDFLTKKLTIAPHQPFLHQPWPIITIPGDSWSKEFSWKTIEKGVICNPVTRLRETRETNTRRIGSFYESHPVPSLSARNRFCRVRIEETAASQGWALCQGCHLTARTTLLSVPFQNTDRSSYLLDSLNRPRSFIISDRSLQQIFTISFISFR